MRSIPPITKKLLLINIVAYFAMYALKTTVGLDLNDVLGLHFFLASDFGLYQLVTYMFMHANFEHILFNMFALWMFGCVVERTWGARRLLIYYMVCGIGAGLIQELAQLGQLYVLASSQVSGFSIGDLFAVAAGNDAALRQWTTVGASGAIYAIMLAFGMLFPEDKLFIFPIPMPIKGKWFVAICVVIELVSAMGTSSDGVAHLAHLGGMLFGFLLIKYWKKHPYDGFGYAAHGSDFWGNMRSRWEKQARKQSEPADVRRQSDAEYNARKQMEQAEVDAILDKIRKNGYDSLTREEKQRLFDQTRH